MEATGANFLRFLQRSPQFVIPIYQRTYSWTERECLQLWEDILRTGSNASISAHFTGSIVYIEEGLYQVSRHSPLLVIDGQQRLTTVMLLLEALARHVGDDEPVNGYSARKLRNYYLLNPEEEGEHYFKLLLTQTDKHSLLALLQQKPVPAEPSLRIASNFEFFNERVKALGTKGLEQLCNGLDKLTVVDVSLKRDQDNPQLIFESMNSTGRELTQADLIRNFILMGLEPQCSDAPLRGALAPYGSRLRARRVQHPLRRVHAALLDGQDRRNPERPRGLRSVQGSRALPRHGLPPVWTLLSQKFTPTLTYYCAMAFDKEPDSELASAFRDIRELKMEVAFPFLLELYDDYARGTAVEIRLCAGHAIG